MITSRNVADLLPPVAERCYKFLQLAKDDGIDLLVTCTYRDFEAQERLFAQGRTIPGQIVTWARGGDSWHNWQRAMDVVPMRAGKPVWSVLGTSRDLWMRVGELGMMCGLEWGGKWPRHPDFPHFQDRTGKTLLQLKKERAEQLKNEEAAARRRR
jgi:peptidoglycan L-alanyl-D-glutamate endopeptidase CwlK